MDSDLSTGLQLVLAAMTFAAVTWLFLALSYILFAGQLSRNELIAGLGASLAAAAYASVAHQVAEKPLRLRLRWDRVCQDLAKSLVLDTVTVGMALLWPTPGAMAGQDLPADESVPSGRRAVAILVMSLAPNGYVIDAQNQQALLHRLVRTRPVQAPP